ncbi:hypothetical protein [Glycomyces albidus]|uniref:Uncharacterized protein n=1 Tax=Glycomyces albidus TaxID=2656774 RepID=A0A6L5G2K4_9ACTN|nr:hypothetical protein [Glycomyces albidus]MQM24007.1 hypothetical protein [Glycomyces albidus]
MPPLLTADRSSLRAKWTAVLAVAAVALAAVFWDGLRDTARGLVPTASERFDWDAADLVRADPAADPAALGDGVDDPAAAGSARLAAGGLVLDLVWEAELSPAAVRVETYEDAFGAGVRMAVAADSTTEGGPHCLNARLTTDADPILLQACSRADRHEPPRTTAEDGWRPDHLLLTQTANLDPGQAATAPLVDYYGLGLDLGNSYDTGLWGPNSWWPQHSPLPECATAPRLMLRLDDLHLTDRYADPDAHTGAPETTAAPEPAFPVEGRLLLPACIQVGTDLRIDLVATEPFTGTAPVPLARWVEFNAASAEPQRLRTAVAVDIRTCEAATADRCSSADLGPGPDANNGVASDWMTELLDP